MHTLPFPKPISKVAEKSPLWRWYQIIEWLYAHGDITDKKMVDDARFIDNVNAALGERDPDVRNYRHLILKKLDSNNDRHNYS